MLFRAAQKTSNAASKILGDDKEFASIGVLPDEEAEDLDQMRVQRNLLNGQVVYWPKSAEE